MSFSSLSLARWLKNDDRCEDLRTVSRAAAADYGFDPALYRDFLTKEQKGRLINRLKEILSETDGVTVLHNSLIENKYKSLLGEEFVFVVTLYEQ